MDLVTFPHKEKPLSLSLREIKQYLLFSLVFSLGIYLLNLHLYDKDFVEELFLFAGEKAQMAHHGASPEIDNWIFVTPLVPYTLTLYLSSPFIAFALISGFMWSIWIFGVYILLIREKISKPMALILWAFLLFTPSSIWLFCEMPQMAFIYTLFAISFYFLRRYFYESVSTEFLMFSLTSALVVQNNIPSLSVYFAYLPATIAVLWVLKRPWLPFTLVILFPTFFFIFAPMAMNGLLHSDFSLTGIFHYFPSFRIPLAGYEGDLMQTFYFYLKLLGESCLIMLPYWFFWFRTFQHQSKMVYLSFLAAPLIYIGVKIYTGSFIDDNASLLLFPLFAILLLSEPFEETKERTKFSHLILMGCFVVAGLFDVRNLKKESHKLDFYKALVGAPFTHHNIFYEKEMAKKIGEIEGMILTDERANYKVLYLVNDAKRFIVPYQYRFQTTLSKPQKFVEWILVSGDFAEDMVLYTYPTAKFGILPGYEVAHQIGPYTLFKRINE